MTINKIKQKNLMKKISLILLKINQRIKNLNLILVKYSQKRIWK